MFDRTIDAHVKNLRRKIEPDPAHPRHVITVRGAGYKFDEKDGELVGTLLTPGGERLTVEQQSFLEQMRVTLIASGGAALVIALVQGALEAMLDGVYPTDRENLQAALAQTHTLSRLVEDLRLLALADTGQLYLHTAPLDLVPFLQEMVETHRIQAQERGVDWA